MCVKEEGLCYIYDEVIIYEKNHYCRWLFLGR